MNRTSRINYEVPFESVKTEIAELSSVNQRFGETQFKILCGLHKVRPLSLAPGRN